MGFNTMAMGCGVGNVIQPKLDFNKVLALCVDEQGRRDPEIHLGRRTLPPGTQTKETQKDHKQR